jgi:hypothetical protein
VHIVNVFSLCMQHVHNACLHKLYFKVSSYPNRNSTLRQMRGHLPVTESQQRQVTYAVATPANFYEGTMGSQSGKAYSTLFLHAYPQFYSVFTHSFSIYPDIGLAIVIITFHHMTLNCRAAYCQVIQY